MSAAISHTGICATDPHRGWLNDRNQILAAINKEGLHTDEQIDDLLEIMVAIEKRINETPARTSDGLVSKMVLAFQVTAEGHELSEEAAADIVREAQCLLDIGSLAGASDEIQMRRAA
ncbi:hypothetical protein [Sphingomonas glacialis]|uniref:Uncharacterized protein n=1 Tax=Sphingomonas glacialis TaxID=658225 RepID=A0A502G324_9SPHN|nr:hypothetical protein [Sphingomonas glacialis]TPG56347.1 hypothetical protein EAH76_01945 [Sphingomonas glacialis]